MTPTKIVVLIILLAPLLLFLLSGCQTAQTVQPAIVTQPVLRCAPASDVIRFLAATHNEVPKYTGVFGTSIVLTVFVSKAKTFTIVHTGVQNEISCLVSSGRNFKELNWLENKSLEL